MLPAKIIPLLALVFVPLVAWSKDATVPALVAAAAAVLANRDARAVAFSPPRLTLPVMLGIAFFTWALAAVMWSPAHRVTDWVKAVPVVLAALVAGRYFARAPDQPLGRLARPVFGAIAALFMLLAVERATGGGMIGLARQGDSTERLFDILSPGLALLSCLVFPGARLAEQATGRAWAGWGLIGAVFALALTYRMDAAPVAIACATISYGLTRIGGKAGALVIAAGITAVALSWGALASLAWRHGEQAWLTAHANLNWGYRVEIWNRVFELIGARPWIGYGFDSARLVAQGPGVSFLHPHNGLLQVWLELGTVGVALLLGWAAAALWAYLKAPRDPRGLATCAATITALSVFWLISFGIWQGWWLAAIGLSFSALILSERAISRSPDR